MTNSTIPISSVPIQRSVDLAAVRSSNPTVSAGASKAPPPAELAARLGSLAGMLSHAPDIPKPSGDALAAVFSGNMDTETLSELAALLMVESGNEQASAAGKRTELQNTGVAEASKQHLEKIKKHFEELRKSEGWGLFAKIFSWAAAIVTTVVAVVVTGGAAAVVAGAALALMAAQELGLTEKFMDMLGIPKEAQGWVMMGLSLVLSVASVGAAIKTFVKKAADIAAKAATERGNKVRAGANVASGSAQVVAGGSQIGATVTRYKSDIAAAAVKQAEADIARTQKAVEEGLAHLKETLDYMATTINEAIMAMLSAHDGKMVTVRAI